MKLFLEVTVVFYVTSLGGCDVSYNYEKLNNFGVGRRVIPNVRRQFLFGQGNAYPEPLPTPSKSPGDTAREPYNKIQQGKRVHKDVKVFKKRFKYPAKTDGHRITCRDTFDCKINYLTIDTENGIPIILRGGVGYYHFTVVIRARAGDPLVGTITAYCVRKEDENAWKT